MIRQRILQREAEVAKKKEEQEKLVIKYGEIIPEVKFDPVKDLYGTTECIICMDSFSKGQIVRRLNTCKHVFHPECLMTWLKSEK